MKLDKYRCHKDVEAVKVFGVDMAPSDQPPGSLRLQVETAGGETGEIIVSPSYASKHKPKVGGFYVRYQDGYESFSPAEAFTEGYTIVEGKTPAPAKAKKKSPAKKAAPKTKKQAPKKAAKPRRK